MQHQTIAPLMKNGAFSAKAKPQRFDKYTAAQLHYLKDKKTRGDLL